jgi:hypothetical protein
MIGAWVSAFLATCCITSLVLAIVLGVSSLGLFVAWLQTCKPKPCKLFAELLWVHVTAVGTAFAYLSNLAPCGLSSVPMAAGTIAAVLAIAVAACT